MTPLRTKEAINNSLVPVNAKIDSFSNLSPYHFEGLFSGDAILQDDFGLLIRPFERTAEGKDFDFSTFGGAYYICDTDSVFYFNTIYNWGPGLGAPDTSNINYTFAEPNNLDGLSLLNAKVGDTISVLTAEYISATDTIKVFVKVDRYETPEIMGESIAISSAITIDASMNNALLYTSGTSMILVTIPDNDTQPIPVGFEIAIMKSSACQIAIHCNEYLTINNYSDTYLEILEEYDSIGLKKDRKQ